MANLYVLVDKGWTGFCRGYLDGLKDSHKYKRIKGFNFDFKVEISMRPDFRNPMGYNTIRAINYFTKKAHKGKDETLDKLLDEAFPSEDGFSFRKCKDLIVVSSKQSKLINKLNKFFENIYGCKDIVYLN